VTRVLLRSRKDPFVVASAERALQENLIGGGNVGNLLFSHAMHRTLSVKGTEVVADGFTVDPDDASRINETYDVYILALANAFRPEFEKALVQLTELIAGLRIPVVVVGVGGQSTLDYDLEPLRPMDGTVKAFARAVLDRSAVIGVRGEFTGRYLNHLGFTEVEVIGCPSMFLHGRNLHVQKKVAQLDLQSKLAINITPYADRMRHIVWRHQKKYPNLIYVAQHAGTLQLMLYGDEPGKEHKFRRIPRHRAHPLYQQNRIRFCLDPSTWLAFLEVFDFTFGTRMHGNIASLLAGTPAYVLAHDSRTLEMCQYFEIPHSSVPDLQPGFDAAELYAAADYDAMNKGHGARFARFVDFLDRNGVDHIFAQGQDGGRSFDERLAATQFPPPVDVVAQPESAPAGTAPAGKKRRRRAAGELPRGQRERRTRVPKPEQASHDRD